MLSQACRVAGIGKTNIIEYNKDLKQPFSNTRYLPPLLLIYNTHQCSEQQRNASFCIVEHRVYNRGLNFAFSPHPHCFISGLTDHMICDITLPVKNMVLYSLSKSSLEKYFLKDEKYFDFSSLEGTKLTLVSFLCKKGSFMSVGRPY